MVFWVINWRFERIRVHYLYKPHMVFVTYEDNVVWHLIGVSIYEIKRLEFYTISIIGESTLIMTL